MAAIYHRRSIDTMSLEMFYTDGICLDLSSKNLGESIDIRDLQAALTVSGLDIRRRDTVLLYTDHYRRAFATSDWTNGPGLTANAARWLGECGISAFGVETLAPGLLGRSNSDVHLVCGALGFTHYENMINLHLLINRGRFRFVGLPLRIRGGTGSPVRAIAVFES